MVNYAGISAVLSAVVRPGLIVPHLTIPSIASLSWQAAKSQGVNYVIFDKDNCLTKPHVDALEQSLTETYRECLDVFGRDNVLIVSNSAGSSSDMGGVGAQHLSRVLFGTPVLCHPAKKPAVACAKQVVDYFGSARAASTSSSSSSSSSFPLRRLFAAKSVQGSEGQVSPHLAKQHIGDILVIGDRIATDTVLSHRVSDLLAKRYPTLSPPRAISILTTTLWANEGPMNTLMRRAEESIRTRLVKRGVRPGGGWAWKAGSQQSQSPMEDFSRILLRPSNDSTTAPATLPLRSLPDTTPTVTSLLVSSLYSTRLPPILKHTFRFLLTNRLTRTTLTFFKHGWLLILKGTKEGLNRPEYVFGHRGRGGNPFTSKQQQQSRTYSTHRRQRQIPLTNWLAAFAAIIIIPCGYLAGEHLHKYIKSPTEEQLAKDIAALQQERNETTSAPLPVIGPISTAAEKEQIIRVKNQVARELDDISTRIRALKQRRIEQAAQAHAGTSKEGE